MLFLIKGSSQPSECSCRFFAKLKTIYIADWIMWKTWSCHIKHVKLDNMFFFSFKKKKRIVAHIKKKISILLSHLDCSSYKITGVSVALPLSDCQAYIINK